MHPSFFLLRCVLGGTWPFTYENKLLNFNFAMQSTGAYKAASRLAIATPPPAYVLSRGIGWQVSWFHAFVVVANIGKKNGHYKIMNMKKKNLIRVLNF